MPWIVIPVQGVVDQFRLPKATFFDLICLGMIGISFFRGLNFRYGNKYLFWFCIWGFISIFCYWYIPFTNTYGNMQNINFFTIAPTIHFLLALWASFITLSYFQEEDYKKISKTICLSSFLVAGFALMQIFGFDPMKKLFFYKLNPSQDILRITAFLGHPSDVANYLCLGLPYFLCQKEKKYLLGFFLVLSVILLCKSAISNISCAVSLSLLFLIKYRDNRKIFYTALGLSFAVCLFFILRLDVNFIMTELNGRLYFWNIAIEHLKDNPLFGQGLGVFPVFSIFVNGQHLTTPHNDWLYLAIQLGIVGVILAILITINSILHFNYKLDNKTGFSYLASFAGFLILMMGTFPMELAPLALSGLVSFWGTEKL